MDGVNENEPICVAPVIIPVGESSTDSEEDSENGDFSGERGGIYGDSGERGGNEKKDSSSSDEETPQEAKAADLRASDAGQPMPGPSNDSTGYAFKCQFCEQTFEVQNNDVDT